MSKYYSTPIINQRLRDARLHCKWSQQQVADSIGTTPNNVSRWELGQTTPGPYFRSRLCTLFNLSTEALGLESQHSLSVEEHVKAAEVNSLPPSLLTSDVEKSEDELFLWNVPYARNPHFTGRDDLFEQLDQHLISDKHGLSGNTRYVALTQPQAIKGLGGIGKTQIAVEYAYRSREREQAMHTLWIHAESEEAIRISFVTLAGLLPQASERKETDQQKLVTIIISWLEQCPHPWLLIFDNADDFSLAQEYLPRQGNGRIIFTTRAQAVGSFAASLEVETMGLVEGTQFLLHRTQRLHVSDDEANEASNIVIALDGFPLALDQAGAFLEETGCRFSEYLSMYQEHRQTLLARRGLQASYYPDSVATTWSLSFQKIEQANPAAAGLLHLCAFLAPDSIPEELLKEGTPYWTPALQAATSDLLAFNSMIEQLFAFSLVKRLAEEQSLSIHRLVQVVQRDMMPPEEQRQWVERVVRAVNAMFPQDPQRNVASWPRCLRYLEQVQACDTLIQEHQLLFPEAADVLDRAGTYLREHASYSLAETLYQRALAIREQSLGIQHLDIAKSLNNLGILYSQQSRYKEAEPLYQRALAIREQSLGIQHPDIAKSLNNLGILYIQQGKYDEAEPLYKRALAIREQHLGPDHPDIASSLNGLGILYSQQGKYEEAELLYQRSLAIREHHLGPQHPITANDLNNLGTLYCRQGKYEQATPLFQRALAIREQILGPDHPDTANSLNNIAELYLLQRHYMEAESLYQRALAIREQQLGFHHLDTAKSLNSLGILYSQQSKYEQAESFYRRALAIREQSLGPNHPDTIAITHRLAELYQQQGKE